MVVTICLLISCAIGLLVWAFVVSHKDKGEVILPKSDCASCDGTNDQCEQECMMEAATKEIEYFDDEELDKYKGRTSDHYSDEEAEEFRYVMYTMKKEEVKEWNRSLILRNVAMPDQIKDEAVMIMNE